MAPSHFVSTTSEILFISELYLKLYLELQKLGITKVFKVSFDTYGRALCKCKKIY